MSVFNLNIQNANLDSKIVTGLERLSQAFRILLWEKAKEFGLSPIQIQVLIFIQYHSREKSTVSYLAQEFNLTKPTISDVVKALEQKKLIKKIAGENDSRSYTIQLSPAGKRIVAESENFALPVSEAIAKSTHAEKVILWDNITRMILQLNRLGVISVQRTCFNCRFHATKDGDHFCNLLEKRLKVTDIRIDCNEFEVSGLVAT